MIFFTTNQHEPTRTTTRCVLKVRGVRVVRGKILFLDSREIKVIRRYKL